MVPASPFPGQSVGPERFGHRSAFSMPTIRVSRSKWERFPRIRGQRPQKRALFSSGSDGATGVRRGYGRQRRLSPARLDGRAAGAARSLPLWPDPEAEETLGKSWRGVVAQGRSPAPRFTPLFLQVFCRRWRGVAGADQRLGEWGVNSSRPASPVAALQSWVAEGACAGSNCSAQ